MKPVIPGHQYVTDRVSKRVSMSKIEFHHALAIIQSVRFNRSIHTSKGHRSSWVEGKYLT